MSKMKNIRLGLSTAIIKLFVKHRNISWIRSTRFLKSIKNFTMQHGRRIVFKEIGQHERYDTIKKYYSFSLEPLMMIIYLSSENEVRILSESDYLLKV